MKNVILIAALFISGFSFAQSNKEDVDLIQSLYGMEKKDIVAEFVQVQGKAKEDFWRLYDEYENARKANGRERLALLEKYATNYSALTEDKIDEIIKETISLGAKTDKLTASYYNKIKKVAGAKAAGQFFQIESYLTSVIRAAILEEIPFIGELE